MTGRCAHCRARTMALPGPANRSERARPPFGTKLGYVIETASRSYLACSECLHRTLLAAA